MIVIKTKVFLQRRHLQVIKHVSNVRDMRGMFYGANSFNGDLSKWNVSNVTNMRSMFYAAKSFNRDLSKWNVSNVTNMSYMFSSTYTFAKPSKNQ